MKHNVTKAVTKLSLGTLFLITAQGCSSAIASDELKQIAVSASAAQTVIPDTVAITFWFEEEGKQLTSLKTQVDQNTARLLSDLDDTGVAEEDVQSYQLQIQPVYDYNNNQRPQQRGFSVQRQVSVTLRESDDYDRIIDLALTRGVQRVGNIQYQVSDSHAAYQQALLEAFSKARTKAEKLAQQAGANLGDAVLIEEQSRGQTYQPKMEMMRASDSVSRPGTEAIEAEVRVTFELNP